MKKKITLFTVILIIIISSSLVFAKNTFYDISGHWAEDTIIEMSERGIVDGIDENHFAPDMEITRAQFIVLLHRILGININYFAKPDIESVFEDVTESDWFGDNLNDMITTGIVNDKLIFRPNEKIKREEAIFYLIRAYNYSIHEEIDKLSNSFDILPITDIEDADSSYKDYILTAYQYNLVEGRDDNFFVPNGYLTRAESLIVMQRLENLIFESNNNKVQSEATYKRYNDGIEIVIDIKNNTKDSITLDFTSGQRYNIELINDNDEVIYDWASEKNFIQAYQFIEINSGEGITLDEFFEFSEFEDLLKDTRKINVQFLGKNDGEKFNNIMLDFKQL